MSRFVEVGNGYLNTDHIESVTNYAKEDKILITMTNGETVTRPDAYLDEVTGRNAIRSLVPVDGCYAEFSPEGREAYRSPVKLIAVTESGEARPVGMNDICAFFLDTVSGYEGVFWEDDYV